MPFVRRFRIHGYEKPVRGYTHEAEAQVFGFKSMGWHENLDLIYLHEILDSNSHLFSPADFLIAALFGKEGKKVVELFGYGDIKRWPGNPTTYSWVFEDGIYKPEAIERGCGDTCIVLGLEESHRRTTPNLETYMSAPPDIGNMLTFYIPPIE